MSGLCYCILIGAGIASEDTTKTVFAHAQAVFHIVSFDRINAEKISMIGNKGKIAPSVTIGDSGEHGASSIVKEILCQLHFLFALFIPWYIGLF
jgi:hypothetical protein